MGKKSSRSESSKSDRKFEKKLEFYAKVRDKVASLGAQKTIGKKKKLRSRQKKLKAYDLSGLSEFLPEVKPKQQPTAALKLNCKSRQDLLIKETNRLRKVLEHPAFQNDPWAALNQHLQSTEPIIDEKATKKSKSVKKAVKGKKKKSKGQSRAQSMEISA